MPLTTPPPVPRDEALSWSRLDLFAALARTIPDAMAVVADGDGIGYADLERRANQLARRLRRLGAGPEVVIGVCLERSIDWVVSLLAVLKSGGVYLPLDPVYPADRLGTMITDSRPPVILTQRSLASRLPCTPDRMVLLDRDRDEIESEPGEPLDVQVSPENLAYAVYTSGSTGTPKAVAVTHRALSNLLAWYQRTFSVSPGERCLQQARGGFDACLFEVLPCLNGGATLHILDDRTRSAPDLLHQWLRTERITIGFLPPVLSEALFDRDLSDLSLRVLFTGSDKANRYPPRSLAATYLNCYGPTEATVIVTCGAVAAEPEPNGRAPAIGRPIDGAELHVLDQRLSPVLAGAVGELYIGGPQVARGYLNDPAGTAERFVPDPFSHRPGARLYRTGDLVRHRPDGNLEFIGRADEQVKLRGYRVEPGEVETVLRRYPGVREAAVLATDDQSMGRRLVGYLLLEAGTELSSLDLRRFLYQNLPYYMVPSALLVVDSWPTNTNGKLDRDGLRRLGGRRVRAHRTMVTPRDPDEAALAAIWSELLGVEDVGPDDNFFELGGHSLIATQIASRIDERLGVSMHLRALFDAPTLADCATAVRQARRAGGLRRGRIQPMSRDREIPLSYPQRGIWFLQQLHPQMRAYNFQTALRLQGTLDVTALRESLAELIQRHEVLRTSFPKRRGVPYQLIHPPYPPSLDRVDLSGLPQDQREAHADRIIQERVQRVFDVSRLPLVEWTLVALAPDDHLLVHVEHHLLHDGWSFTILIEELLRLYQAKVEGREPGLPDLPLQFADYAIWQEEWLRGEDAAEQLAYWRRQLAGAPPMVTVPADHPRPPVQSFRGGTVLVELPTDVTGGLRRLVREQGATLFVAMVAAYDMLLWRYTGQDDIVVGTSIANRNRPETERLVGMLVNTQVTRVDISGDPTFRQLLDRVKEVVLRSHANQDIPFERLVQELHPGRDIGHNPLYQVSFNFHDSPMPLLTLPGLSVSLCEGVGNGSAKFDLNVVAIPRLEQSVGRSDVPREGGVLLMFEYCGDLFERDTITHLARNYLHLVVEVVADPDRPISSVPLVNEEERRRLLTAWNSAPVGETRAVTVLELLDTPETATPKAVALATGLVAMSRRELNERANRLAHALIRQGAGPGQAVAVLVPDAAERVVAMLAVLKAGAAYLQLDPDEPPPRLRPLLERATPVLVVTTAAAADRLPAERTDPRLLLDDAAELARIDAGPASAPSDVDLRRPLFSTDAAYLVPVPAPDGRLTAVVIDHRSLTVALAAAAQGLDLGPDDVVGVLPALPPGAAAVTVLAALSRGAGVVLPSPEDAADTHRLTELCGAWGVSVLHATPESWRCLVGTGWRAAGLTAVSHGEALPVDLARELVARHARVLSLYGPAETTTVSLLRAAAGAEPTGDANGFVTAGGPTGAVQAYVLDRHGGPTPVGVLGELYLGGSGVARGYLGEPSLTAARFVPDPFSDVPGARLYRTGVRARRRADGDLELWGRVDRQVAVGGHWIEPAEIEVALREHPDVREATVVARPAANGAELVVCLLSDHQWPTGAAIRDFLAPRLPERLLPRAVVVLPEWPLTPDGRIDRDRLASVEPGVDEPVPSFVAPRTAVEERLAAIWAEVLEVAWVSVDDNFFQLGGNSLLGMLVVARTTEEFGVDIPVASIFESPTVAGIAAEIARAELDERIPTRAPAGDRNALDDMLAEVERQ